MPSRAEPIEKTQKKITPNCQPPACQGIPVATTDRSEMTQCQAEKTGDIEQTNAWQEKKKGRQTFTEFMDTWQNNVKAPVDNTLQISPLCHLL